MFSDCGYCSLFCVYIFFFKQKTAYEMRISDWSSDVCSSDLLLTGVVGTEFSRDEATRLAWAASDRINEVINELQVDANDSLLDSASDTWISSQLRFKIATDEKIVDINYNIDTVNGIVYLIGLAQSEEELTRVDRKSTRLNSSH